MESLSEAVESLELECDGSIEAFRRDLQKLRTGRASVGLLSGIMVDYYGTKTHLSHLGQVSAPDARSLVVQVYDAGAADSVEKAIRNSDLGLNPARDGNLIRVAVPVLTEESRRDLVRHLQKMAEEIRVSIRNHRRDANELLKKEEKDSAFSKDDIKRTMEQVQKLTDKFVQEVDKLLEAKQAEVMEV